MNNKQIVTINLQNRINYNSLVRNQIKEESQIKVWNIRLDNNVVKVTKHMSNRKISINGSYPYTIMDCTTTQNPNIFS